MHLDIIILLDIIEYLKIVRYILENIELKKRDKSLTFPVLLFYIFIVKIKEVLNSFFILVIRLSLIMWILLLQINNKAAKRFSKLYKK